MDGVLRALLVAVLLAGCPAQKTERRPPADGARQPSKGSGTLVAGARGAPGVGARAADGDSAPLPVLGAAVLAIGERYVAPSRVDPPKMFDRALEYVEAERPEILVKGRAAEGRVVVQVGSARRRFRVARLTSPSVLYTELKRVLGWVRAQVSAQNRDVDAKELAELEYAAVNGLCTTLDPHSVLMPPDLYGEMRIRTRGAFGGVGIVISIRDGQLTVIAPIDDTPAARAGIRAGDRIVRIEDESTVNMPLSDAVARLRGKPGTPVVFWISREGWVEPRRFRILRERIEIKSVSSRVLPGRVGYLRISRFSGNTTEEVTAHLVRLRKAGIKGLILDLWNNPGGLLRQAEQVADLFLSSGDIVITEAARGVVVHVEKATAATTRYKGPLVVLLSGGSASAAEIVAGAIQNNGRGLVLGERSFGKGTVQMLFENPDRSALKLTVAQYLTPGGISIQGVGVVPDVMTNGVIVRKKWTRLFGHEVDARRRAKRKDLLPARSPHRRQARYRVDYLSPLSELPKRRRPKGHRAPRYSAGENAADDAVVDLARQMLARHAGGREAMLRAIRPLIARWSHTEERRILRALAARGVDWRPPPAEAATARAQDLRVTARFEPAGGVRAGAAAALVVTVRNTGKTPIYRLRGRTLSPSYFLDEIEVLVGALPPGARRTLRFPVSLPSYLRTSVQPVELRLESPTLDAAVVARARIAALELPRPSFVLSYRLHDDVRGNGDGRPEPGETIRLQVAVRNAGAGPANAALVALRNLTGHGVYLERGRASVTKLAPGATANVELVFRLEPTLRKGPLRLELSAYDRKTRAALVRTLRIPLSPPSPTSPGLLGKIAPPRIHLDPVPTVAAPGARALWLSGRVTDPLPVRDLYVEVTNDSAEQLRQKVYYRSVAGGELSDLPAGVSPPGTGRTPTAGAPPPRPGRPAGPRGARRPAPEGHELRFRAPVPLWKGLNELVVVARGADGVLGIRRVVVLVP